VSLYIDWGPTDECARQARITSLSVGGCFVQTEDAAQFEQTVFLRFSAPDPLVVRTQVRYHMPGVGFGVMFDELPIETRLTLEDLVAHYQQQPTAKT
jgi:hypothetical protein